MHTARPLRVGWVDFVNVLPLAPALATVKDIEVVRGVPTQLNAWLNSGAIDVAPISSVEYARHESEYEYLPGLSISSDGPTRSVLVSSQVDGIRRPSSETGGTGVRVHLTPASATSVVLLKILAQFAWPKSHLSFTSDAQSARAWLQIGDEALREHLFPTRPYHVDLGEAWLAMTGLPMVFALFCARKDAFADSRAETLAALHAALRISANDPDRQAAAEQAATQLSLPLAGVREYLDGLSYDLSPRHEQGLATFYDLAERIGEAPHHTRLTATHATAGR
jgi:chorismate dehydratase